MASLPSSDCWRDTLNNHHSTIDQLGLAVARRQGTVINIRGEDVTEFESFLNMHFPNTNNYDVDI